MSNVLEYYTYILECRDGSLYIGYTTDLKKRIKMHNDGKGAKYTRGRTPLKLLYYETFFTKSEAMQKEALLKKKKRKDRLAYIQKMQEGKASVDSNEF